MEARHVFLAQDKIWRGKHTILVIRGTLRAESIRLLEFSRGRHAGLSSPSLFQGSAVRLLQIVQHFGFEPGDGCRRFIGLFETVKSLSWYRRKSNA